MDILNYEEMTLESEVFEQARMDFNYLLQKMFKKMEQSDSDEGSVTLKVDIQMSEDFIPTESGAARKIRKPLVKFKSSSSVPVKENKDGKKDTGMELVYDDDLKRYVLKYVSVGGQRSMFDDDFQEEMQNGFQDDGDVKLLTGETNLLEDKSIVDAEAVEVAQDDDNCGNDSTDSSSEEIQEDDETNVASGDTEASEGVDTGYEYDE